MSHFIERFKVVWNRRELLWIFLIGLLVCTSFSWAYPIYILDEARNSEAAREMWESGNYLIPYYNGNLRTDKPPFHYFFMALGYSLFGVGPLGARFFSGFFGALTLLLTYYTTLRFQGKQVARLSAVIFLSSVYFIQEFHLAVPDPYLIFFMSGTIMAFLLHYRFGERKWLLLMYSCFGFGVLTKGPIALALPGLIILLFLLLKRDLNWKRLKRLNILAGALLFLGLVLPWYTAVHYATEGAWTKGFFFDHNLSRFSDEKEGHGGGFYMTILFTIAGLLPFSVFGIQAFTKAWRERMTSDWLLMCFLGGLVPVVFFSISSTKLPNYPMPAYPFICMVIANYLFMKHKTGFGKWDIVSGVFLLLITAILPFAGYNMLDREWALHDLQPLAYWLGLLFLGSTVAFLLFIWKKWRSALWTVSLTFVFTGLMLFSYIYPKLTAESPVQALVSFVKEPQEVIVFRRMDSAMPMYYNRTFEEVDSLGHVKQRLQANPELIIITNSRDHHIIDSIPGLEIVFKRKGLFENHFTRVYKKVN